MPAVPWPPSSRPATPESPLERLQSTFQAVPPETQVLILSSFALGIASTAGAGWTYKRFFKRTRNSEWVTPRDLERKRWIKGVVTSVGDADNFRVYHTPGFGWKWPLKLRSVPSTAKDLKDQTIHIRMAGVDAPEGAHFGRPAQPFAEEALVWLKNKVEKKVVYCQLIRRDQYGRIVAIPHLPFRFPLFRSFFTGPNLSHAMLRAGWVEVYEQSGAEYGKYGKDSYLQIQEEARRARRGIWGSAPNAQGGVVKMLAAMTGSGIGVSGSDSSEATARESPAEYKRRYAALEKEKDAVEKENRKERLRSERESILSSDAGGKGVIGRMWEWLSSGAKR